MTDKQKPRVIIVGAGFGGLNAAKILSSSSAVHLTVLDRRNHHLFQPLLYQVAMAGLSPAEIAVPIRSILRKSPATDVFLEHVKKIDLQNRKIITDDREYTYDFLVLACGATHSYFGHDEWEEHAPGLKTVEQATEIRRRVLMAFELAEKEPDREKRRDLLTFVIVGGGPTGVELAGSLAEISRHTLTSDFHHIDPAQARIILIEGGSRVLAQMSEKSSRRAAQDLERLGVTIWTNSVVTQVSASGVNIGAEHIRASTVLWAAGVRPSALAQTLGVELDRAGRVKVEPDCSLRDYPEVFVIGDLAHFAHTSNEEPLPGVAPVAMQQGRFVARTILREVRGLPRKTAFVYWDKGMLATIGRADAVAEFRQFRIGGFLAWLMWLVVHVYYLIGFKNRLIVLIQWAWGYLSYRRGARLIASRDWKSNYR